MYRLKFYISVIILMMISIQGIAQSSQNKTVIRGTIRDSVTRAVIPMATVRIAGTSYGAMSDEKGDFHMTITSSSVKDTLTVVYMGYHTKKIKFNKHRHNDLRIVLLPEDFRIEDVVVTGKRKRYVKKDNPAVALMKRIIERAPKSDPKRLFNHYDYERYEKILFTLADFDKDFSNKRLNFLSEYRDTNSVTGKPILPFSIKERIIKARVEDGKKNESTLARRSKGIDEKFSQENIATLLELLLDELDIFKTDIYFLKRHFVSPISPLALSYYKFYLAADTISYAGDRCVELSFYPFSAESLGFSGKLYVRADSTCFVRGAEFNFPNSMNINFVSDLTIKQYFDEGDRGQRILVKDDMNFSFKLISKEDKGFGISRLNSYRDYKFLDQPPTAALPVVETEEVDDKEWAELSHEPESVQEKKIDEMVTRLRKVPFYRLAEWVLVVAEQGYIETGKKSPLDIGPISSFLSGNTLEGTRMQLGGMTTPHLFKNVMLEGFASYGTKDKKTKYNVALEYSFNDKKRTFKEFPVHSLRAEMSYDVFKFGHVKGFETRENIFSWLKRSEDSSLTYMRNMELTYTRESKTNFSVYVKARHYTQTNSAVLQFSPEAGGVSSFKMSELKVNLRYAPNEKIYATKVKRRTLEAFNPVFAVSHTIGFKGILNSSYKHNFTEVNFVKRFNLLNFGYADVRIAAGAEWDKVPYMLLPMASTNQAYLLIPGTFALMKPMEFLFDRFARWDVTWQLNGLILNRIPLIKKLKLREVVTFKGMFGSLTAKNNPVLSRGLVPFPTFSSPMSSKPYMELGVGVDNILKVIRLDYVWRLTNNDKPGVDKWAILFGLEFKF